MDSIGLKTMSDLVPKLREVAKALEQNGVNVHASPNEEWWTTAGLLEQAATEIEKLEVEKLATIGRERKAVIELLKNTRFHSETDQEFVLLGQLIKTIDLGQHRT